MEIGVKVKLLLTRPDGKAIDLLHFDWGQCTFGESDYFLMPQTQVHALTHVHCKIGSVKSASTFIDKKNQYSKSLHF